MAKRALDALASAIGLLLLLPLFVVVALWVRLDSPGPAFFRQVRVGRYGRHFRIHKFRTMRHSPLPEGREITVSGDPRVTRAGRILRRHKLDELPQLIDVLLGDMSLVGPRPEVPDYVRHYSASDRALVLSVRPGITDCASLKFRDESTLLATADDPHRFYIEEIMPLKLKYYREYVTSRSLIGDIRIVIQTLHKVMLPSD